MLASGCIKSTERMILMAKTNMQDPLSGEARSAWLAGLTEACNKISGILNMKTATFTDLPLTEVFISATDRYRIYQVPLGNKLWLTSPAPIVKKNGIVITPENDHFEIDYLGGSINFESFINDDGAKDYYRLTGSDTLTVSATYIVEGSQVIDDIESTLANVGLKANHFKGYWATYDALVNGVTTGQSGDYAIIGDENTFYIWNMAETAWVNASAEIDLSDYYTKQEINTSLESKQNKLTGTAGQVVGFDSSGNAIAQAAPATGLTQAEADARYLKLSGGRITGTTVFEEQTTFKDVAYFYNGSPNDDGFYIHAIGISQNGDCYIAEILGGFSDEPVRLSSIANPIYNLEAANKKYVDDAISTAITGAINASY